MNLAVQLPAEIARIEALSDPSQAEALAYAKRAFANYQGALPPKGGVVSADIVMMMIAAYDQLKRIAVPEARLYFLSAAVEARANGDEAYASLMDERAAAHA